MSLSQRKLTSKDFADKLAAIDKRIESIEKERHDLLVAVAARQIELSKECAALEGLE